MNLTSVRRLWICPLIVMQFLFAEPGAALEAAAMPMPESAAQASTQDVVATKKIVPLETVLPEELLLPGRTATESEPVRGSIAQLAALPPVTPHSESKPFPVEDLLFVVCFLAFTVAALLFVIYAFVRGFKKNHLITAGLCAALVLVLDAASVSVSTKAENYVFIGLMKSPLAFSLSLAAVALSTLIAIRVFGRTAD